MIIAIDGTSASGKSTVAKTLADELNLVNLNSGNLYRTLALNIYNAGVDFTSKEDTLKYLSDKTISMLSADEILFDGKEVVISELRTPTIDKVSSKISFYIPVREKVNDCMRNFAKTRNIICEGRDITSVVFPDTQYKFFIDADVNERARRRTLNYNGNFEQILADLKKRDTDDYSKPFGALRVVEGAVYINSTHKTVEEVCAIIKDNINKEDLK